VVGDVIGTGSAQEQAVVGVTPNLAARLQAVAQPNMVVIAGHAQSSSYGTSGQKTLKALLDPCEPGSLFDRVQSKADSRRYVRAA